MYRVMVVDDEPSALQHICSIIEKKCPAYEVVVKAENGEEALERIPDFKPDIIISDVKMPRMDGIKLVSRVQKEYPDIITVIVSGYQDFEYAKGAIRSGVCDYLLKPLKPSDMQELLQQLQTRLDTLYYSKRIEMLKAMCNNTRLEEYSGDEKYFQPGEYHAAIVRKNGLPKRFSRQTGIEIFSTEEEKILVYGRDEMEALYLFPQELLAGRNFQEVVQTIYEAEKSKYFYVTAVFHAMPFGIGEFPKVVKKLYRKLDACIVIGKNQCVSTSSGAHRTQVGQQEKEQRAHVEYLIIYQENGKLLKAIATLFDLWEQAEHNQIFVEAQVRYILQMVRKYDHFFREYGDYNFIIDDAFYYVTSMEELKLEIQELLIRLLPALKQGDMDDKEQLFQNIRAYLHNHLKNPLTINGICREFGVSQTTLSRWFRKYENTSFSNYLTDMRIEKAKQIMRQDPDAYVKDIAERVGYNDPFYFSRIFRSVVGVCPREYTEQNG